MTELEKQNLIISQIDCLRKIIETCRPYLNPDFEREIKAKIQELIGKMK